jgi:hypothetical protein
VNGYISNRDLRFDEKCSHLHFTYICSLSHRIYYSSPTGVVKLLDRLPLPDAVPIEFGTIHDLNDRVGQR